MAIAHAWLQRSVVSNTNHVVLAGLPLIPNSNPGLQCLGGVCASLSAKGEACEIFRGCEGDLACDVISKLCTLRKEANMGDSSSFSMVGEGESKHMNDGSDDNDEDDRDGVNVGPIAGGVGAIVALLALLALVCCCFWRRRRATEN